MIALFLTASFPMAQAQEKPMIEEKNITEEQVIALVQKAVKLLQETGEEGLKKIGEPNGEFHQGELYVFVFNEDITTVAHPAKPTLVGTNFRGKPDVKGKLFRDEIVTKTLADGKGWTTYIFQKPGASGLYNKKVYSELAEKDGKKYIVNAGMYDANPYSEPAK
jgi:polar amino acid transport system substrate-binding protein